MEKTFQATNIVFAISLLAVCAAARADVSNVLLPPVTTPFNAGISVVKQLITQDGSSISGYGVISSINGQSQDSFCPSHCQLTFQYSGITRNAANMYEGGSVTLYYAETRAVDTDNIGDPAFFNMTNTSTDTPFLTLHLAAPFTGFTDGNGGLASLLQLNVNETGLIGARNAYFNTNGRAGGADLSLNISSTVQSNGADNGTFSIGSGNLFGATASVPPSSIPEPASIALASLGLLGIGAIRHKRAMK